MGIGCSCCFTGGAVGAIGAGIVILIGVLPLLMVLLSDASDASDTGDDGAGAGEGGSELMSHVALDMYGKPNELMRGRYVRVRLRTDWAPAAMTIEADEYSGGARYEGREVQNITRSGQGPRRCAMA